MFSVVLLKCTRADLGNVKTMKVTHNQHTKIVNAFLELDTNRIFPAKHKNLQSCAAAFVFFAGQSNVLAVLLYF